MTETATNQLLLLEDDPILCLDAEEALTEAGFLVVTASSGSNALDLIDEGAERFRAVVADVRLGNGPNGWDVGRRVRELVPTMPIIYMTAQGGAEWAAHGVPHSILIQKPFVAAQLVNAVTTLLNELSSSLPLGT